MLTKSSALLGLGFPRDQFLGLQFDCCDTKELTAALAARPADAPFLYVVTPNVDAMVRLWNARDPQQAEIWDMYRGAGARTNDSRILRPLARRFGIELGLAPGSDVAAELFARVLTTGDRVAIVGSTTSAIAKLRGRYPAVEFLHHEPPMGLRQNPVALDAAAAFVAEAGARFTFLSVGAPQQEMLAARVAARGDAVGTGLCFGAAIDFLTGDQRRAPLWLRRLTLEWAHRLLCDPRRLAKRYLIDGPRIVPLALRWAAAGRPDGPC